MEVLVFNEQDDLALDLASVKPVVKSVLKMEKRATDEVSIYFVTSSFLCSLHEEFFSDPSPTDCISFPMDQNEKTTYHILGEIFICPKSAIEYAKEEPYLETTLYLVHGLLHLLGYDDIEEKDRKKMRDAEKQHMKYLVQKEMILF